MEHSISVSHKLECPYCGKNFEADLWFLVDTAQRPDLERRIRDGSISRVTCPYCHKEDIDVDHMLLVFRPGMTPTLVFCAPEGTDPEELREVANYWSWQLHLRLGDAWRDEWIAAGLRVVNRDRLAGVVGSDGPHGQDDPTAENYIPPTLRDAFQAAMTAVHLYLQRKVLETIDPAIHSLEAIVNHPDFRRFHRDFQSSLLGLLGDAYYDRYLRPHEPDDLERAIDRLGEAVAVAPSGSARIPACLLDLGLCFSERYERHEEGTDFDRSVAFYQKALAAIERMPEIHARVLLYLGDVWKRRFRKTHDLDALDLAIRSYSEADGMEIPEGIDRIRVANALSNSYYDRHKWRGDLEDLGRAIDVGTRAIKEVPPGTVGLIEAWNHLGAARLDLYTRAGGREMLDAAVSDLERAVALDVDSSEELAQNLNDLGSAYRTRYEATHRWADMERAIATWRKALELARSPRDDVSAILHNLASGLTARFARTGNTDDLEAAAELEAKAVAATPQRSSGRGLHYNSLGQTYLTLYQRFERPELLAAAIHNLELAQAHTAEGSMWQANGFNALGKALWLRGQVESNPRDIDRAVGLFEKAVAAAPPGTPSRLEYIHGLASALMERYQQRRDPEDLERALRELEAALGEPGITAPFIEQYQETLARLWTKRHARTGDDADAARAVERFHQAIQNAREHDSPFLLVAGANWGHWAFERGDWSTAVEAYGYAMEGTDRLFRAQGSRPGQESWLREIQGLTSRAAYALAGLDRAEEAAVALEKGLAVILADAVTSNPVRLDDLEARGHRDLAEAYRIASGRLSDLSQAAANDESGPMADPGAGAVLEEGRKQLDGVIETIRRVDGFEGFLLPPTIRDIREALSPAERSSCLAYLAITTVGAVALIVTVEAVEGIRLELTRMELGELLVRVDGGAIVGGYVPGQLGSETFLTEALDLAPRLIGDRVLGPLAARLRQLGAADVVLIPSGWLALLPLGAIGYKAGEAETCLLDEFVVRYAPSARVLASAQREGRRREGPLSLVGVGNPLPGARSLPAAEAELAAVAGHFPQEARHAFTGTEATLENVLEWIATASHLHFACHGSFRPSSPLDSELALSGPDRIRLRDLIDGPALPARARLAVLSACQSAVTDFSRLPDEFIGLPSGFLQAGVPSVVGTLWSVDDPSTSLLMEIFYDLYLPEASRSTAAPLAPAIALGLAQRTLRDLTADELRERIERERRKPRHERRFPDQILFDLWGIANSGANNRPFAAPIYWMAFTYHGA